MKKAGFIALTIGILLFSSAGSITQSAAKPNSGDTIPYPSGYDIDSSGASQYHNRGDHVPSKYYAHPDFFNLIPTYTMALIPKFKTYQQTTQWSCGCCAALMVLNHFGNEQWDELKIAGIMKSNQDLNGNNAENPGQANERGEYGTSTTSMVNFFKYIGWDVQSSILPEQKQTQTMLADHTFFAKWVITNLKKNTPIMVEWIDWGGHWQDIIGYDTMGTEDLYEDDVLILADSYDTTDQLQDGYYIFSASRFLDMWFDAHMLPKDQSTMQWVIASPKQKS